MAMTHEEESQVENVELEQEMESQEIESVVSEEESLHNISLFTADKDNALRVIQDLLERERALKILITVRPELEGCSYLISTY